jgi:predicted small lipoprotein YifL
MMNIRYPLALILSFLFAVGCGQSGPLYLPGDPSTIKTELPGQDEGQSEKSDDKEDEEESSDTHE